MAVRILIADDHAAVRRALRHVLEDAGYCEIAEAPSGNDAVTLANQLKPELVILDLAMPDLDGLRAARKIKRLLPTVPIVIHTLHWSRRVEIEALKAGVQKVVPKSDRGKILSAVQELLPTNRSSAATSKPTDKPTAPPDPVLSKATTAARAKPNGGPGSSDGRVPED